MSPMGMLMSNVVASGCWEWRGQLRESGYPIVQLAGRKVRAHRLSYELFVGPIPDGMTVDHLCHNEDRSCPGGPGCRHRRCVNPFHLGIATAMENWLRACIHARRDRPRAVGNPSTHCLNGHPRNKKNLYVHPSDGRHRCRACNREYAQSSRRHRRALDLASLAPTG